MQGEEFKSNCIEIILNLFGPTNSWARCKEASIWSHNIKDSNNLKSHKDSLELLEIRAFMKTDVDNIFYQQLLLTAFNCIFFSKNFNSGY